MADLWVFDKKDTQSAKGFAILLMLFHHLFAYSRIPYPYLSMAPDSFVTVFSQFGNVCVAVFMFLSGFGMYQVSLSKDIKSWRIGRFLSFIARYYLVFILFVPLGFIFFGRPFIVKECILNLLFLSCSYNREWWFIRIYLELLLLSPYLLSFFKNHEKWYLAGSLIFSAAGFLLHDTAFIWGKELSNLFLWQLLFTAGFLFARHGIFSSIFAFFQRHKLDNVWLYLLLIAVCVLLRQEPLWTPRLKDPFLAPVLIFSCVRLAKKIHIEPFFAFLGRHSLHIWLIHTFFCYYYVPKLVFLPKYTLFIFLWLLLLSLGASLLIEATYKLLGKGLKKCGIRFNPNEK